MKTYFQWQKYQRKLQRRKLIKTTIKDIIKLSFVFSLFVGLVELIAYIII